MKFKEVKAIVVASIPFMAVETRNRVLSEYAIFHQLYKHLDEDEDYDFAEMSSLVKSTRFDECEISLKDALAYSHNISLNLINR